MVDLTQFGTVAGLALLVGIVIQVLKPLVAAKVVPYLALGLGLVLAVLIGFALGRITSTELLASYLVGGLLAGLAAIGGYEATLDKIIAMPSAPVVVTLPPKG